MGETIPNFLSPEIHSILYQRLCCTPQNDQDFYWNYHAGVTSEEDNNFYFTNLLLDRTQMNSIIKVKTQDAIDRMKRFSREAGLLVGISSGANLLAAEKYVQNLSFDGIIVTMLCDRGERYL